MNQQQIFEQHHTRDEISFAQFLKRPTLLNKRNIKTLIDDISDEIVDLRGKIRGASSQLEKNLFYLQIENRQLRIKHLNNKQ